MSGTAESGFGLTIPTEEGPREGLGQIVWQRFSRHPGARAGAVVFIVLVIAVLLAPLSPYDPEISTLQERFQPPSWAHPMGTDALGRDLMTRVLYGGRVSLTVGLLVVGITLTLGVTVGALVTAYQPAALATVQQLDPIYVDVTQSSADLLKLRASLEAGRLKAGGARKVRLVLENGQPYPLEGRFQFRDVTVDPGTGAVTLRMVFPNPKQVLLPGMSPLLPGFPTPMVKLSQPAKVEPGCPRNAGTVKPLVPATVTVKMSVALPVLVR